ncbi:MAG: PD40 domain-containing protein [Bacteroidetes bacterium]|nr:PD40 domain-containing protein [Bacteroidota bacterium]
MSSLHRCMLALIVILLTSCTPRPAKRAFQGCLPPPPPPSCSPLRLERVDVDTSSGAVLAPETHWKISIVRGANTREDEFALLPAGDVDVLMWGVNMAHDQYMTVERTMVDSVSRMPARSSEKRFMGVVRGADIMGDASIASATVVNDELVVDEVLSAPVNTPIFWDAQPTTSRDGTLMIFASDREGGMGGTDLWYTRRTPSGWSEPVNMGDRVNTPCDELSPCLVHGDTTLLFSSAGRETVGGYDLFRTAIDARGTSVTVAYEARNVGAPVNTRADEMFPYIPAGHTEWPLYYASNQKRTFDIWVLHRVEGASIGTPREKKREIAAAAVVVPTMLTPMREDSVVPDSAILQGTVVMERSNTPVAHADVQARDVNTPQLVNTTKTDINGNYALKVPTGANVEVSAQSADLFFDSKVINIPAGMGDSTISVPQFEIPLTFYLRINFPTNVFNDPYPNTLDSNGIETSTSWQASLDLIATNIRMSGDRLQKLVLIGHTDEVGTTASNLVLGKHRVEFVIEELVKRGVSRQLLEGRTAGESLLPARRRDEPTDVWRKRARRVELVKVLR